MGRRLRRLLGGKDLGEGGIGPELLPFRQKVAHLAPGGLGNYLLGAHQKALGGAVPGNFELIGAFGLVAAGKAPPALENRVDQHEQNQQKGGQLGGKGVHSAPPGVSSYSSRRAVARASWKRASPSGKASAKSQRMASSRRNQVSCRLA